MMKRLLALLAALMLLVPAATAETLQDCHRVTLTKKDTTQKNKSIIRVWTADTALDSVDAELASITQDFVDNLGPTLQKAANKTSKNSRMDVEIRYSRTGLTWMSFLVQARVTYHRDLIHQEIVSRTYDMITGEQIFLTDVFDEDSEGWDILADAVRTQVEAYFPDEAPDAEQLDVLASREALEMADFTFHGMSMVIHIPAALVYPGHNSLIEVTLMYPEIREYMTDRAQEETDNLSYYKMCALTFDDGPSRTNTSLTLNNLMLTGSRATFFVLGNRIKEYDDLIQREHDEGHAIASHNWHHGDARKSSASALRGMRDKCDKALIAAIGIPTRYNRVPYGLYPQMIKAKTGWAHIQWSVDTYDWRGKSAKAVLNTVKKEIHDGAIILCHDIKDNTPAAAELVCKWLAENGYMLLTIDELFAKDGVTLAGDEVYFRCEDGETTIKKK
ncbi:MAG: polysaccharide deacetylase family protein [Clostridia bacterium]|nr:polysaccharide deacetylase family protein [Clostridia bacterium]